LTMEDLCRSFHQRVYILRRLGVLAVLAMLASRAPRAMRALFALAKTFSWRLIISRARHVIPIYDTLLLSETVVEARRRTLGDEHPDTLGSIHNLALEYSNVGRRRRPYSC
jgi:Tetratricopeptide repeat